MAFVITREKEHFFLNGVEIRGLQNVQVEYPINAVPLRYIGLFSVDYLPDGPQIGKVSLTSLLAGADPFISLINNTHSNGYILRSKTETMNNVAFSGAFLSSYSAKFAVGTVPEVNAVFDVHGNLGRLPESESTAQFAAIAANDLPSFSPTSPGDLVLSVDGFNPNRVYSCDIDINVKRNVVYGLGSRYFKRFDLVYPIEIVFSFSITRDDYLGWHNRRFPKERKTTNFSLALLDSKTKAVTNTYNFSNLLLFSERTTANSTDKSLVNLEYRTHMVNPNRVRANKMYGTTSGKAYIKNIGQDTFDEYFDLQSSNLNGGIGWARQWGLVNRISPVVGLLGVEIFDWYQTGDISFISGGTPVYRALNSGNFWSGQWAVTNFVSPRLGLLGYEHFEWYPAGIINTVLDSGNFWNGAWQFNQTINPLAGLLGLQGLDDFESYDPNNYTVLNDGFGWSGAWAGLTSVVNPFTFTLGYESFDEYSDGQNINGAAGGDSWNGAWISATAYDDTSNFGLIGYESFDEYSAGDIYGVNGGVGWSGTWVVGYIGLDYDDFEQDIAGAINGVGGGQGWGGNWSTATIS